MHFETPTSRRNQRPLLRLPALLSLCAGSVWQTDYPMRELGLSWYHHHHQTYDVRKWWSGGVAESEESLMVVSLIATHDVKEKASELVERRPWKDR